MLTACYYIIKCVLRLEMYLFMKKVRIATSQKEELVDLQEIFLESKNYFMDVEGREPLKPFEDIRKIIGNPPEKEEIVCHTIFYNEEIVGYIWTLEKPSQYYYILHFYIKNSHKRKGIGRNSISILDSIFSEKNINKSELLVSGSNYLGLKFWTNIGYDKIIYIEAPDENSLTTSVEIELSRIF